MSLNNKTYTDTYKIWDIFFCEHRGRFYAYDVLDEEYTKCAASNEFLSELIRDLDKLFKAL